MRTRHTTHAAAASLGVMLSLFVRALPGQAVTLAGSAPRDSSSLVRSAAAARHIVLDAISAIGGIDALNRLRSLSVERPFERTTTGQGIKPGVPGRSSGVDLLDMDLARGRYRTLRDMEIDGGQLYSPATIVTPNAGWFLNYANHVVINASPATMLATRADILRREVPTLLLSALRRSTTLRLLPPQRRGEQEMTFADIDGSQVSIAFDAATHLPSRTEIVTDDPDRGDATVVTRFSDYREIPGGLRLAAVVQQEVGAARFDMTLGSVRVNQPDDSVFVVPKSFEPAGPAPSPAIAPGVVSLGPGVAIEFADFVLVFEAYGDSRWTEPSLARIHTMIPNKPIRYVVLSHYHGDHIGGIRGFAAAGASIITVSDAVAPIRNVLFACLTAPARGGATPLADGAAVLDALPRALVERFERVGWLLVRNYGNDIGSSVADAFGTDDRSNVESYCRANDIKFEWRADGGLRTWQHRSAVVRHPLTGRRSWFNQIAFLNEWTLNPEVREYLVDEYGEDGLPFNTRLGNGEPIGADVVEAINGAYEANTVREPWEGGDLLVVDNIRTAHGREAFEGPREIVVGMADPIRMASR